MNKRILVVALAILSWPVRAADVDNTSNLQRVLISFKNHIAAGMSYSEYPNAMADVNSEIELADRGGVLNSAQKNSMFVLRADMIMMNMAWSLHFGPLADHSSPFTFCKSEVGQFFARTGEAFKEQGLLDADLETTEVGGGCAYYNDETIGQLLSALDRQAEKSLDVLTVKAKPVRKH